MAVTFKKAAFGSFTSALFLVGTLTSSAILAKGLDELEPTPPPAEGAGPAVGAVTTPPVAPVAEVSKTEKLMDDYSKDRLQIKTAFGWMRSAKGSALWHSSGSGDVSLVYDLKRPWQTGSLLAQLRWLAIDVAPDREKAGAYAGSVGAVTFYLAGVRWQRPIRDRLSAYGLTELGIAFATFRPMIDGGLVAKRNETGVNFDLGGGLDWAFLEKFHVGPKMLIGFGYLSTVNLALDFSFLF